MVVGKRDTTAIRVDTTAGIVRDDITTTSRISTITIVITVTITITITTIIREF